MFKAIKAVISAGRGTHCGDGASAPPKKLRTEKLNRHLIAPATIAPAHVALRPKGLTVATSGEGAPAGSELRLF